MIALKAKADKLDIDKLNNVPRGLNNLKTKVGNLDDGKLKTVPFDLKIFFNVVNKEVLRKTKYNKLNSKVDDLEDRNPKASILTQINPCNADNQNLERTIENVDKTITDTSKLITNTAPNTKIRKVEKNPDVSSLVANTVINKKLAVVNVKLPDVSSLVTTTALNT